MPLSRGNGQWAIGGFALTSLFYFKTVRPADPSDSEGLLRF